MSLVKIFGNLLGSEIKIPRAESGGVHITFRHKGWGGGGEGQNSVPIKCAPPTRPHYLYIFGFYFCFQT